MNTRVVTVDESKNLFTFGSGFLRYPQSGDSVRQYAISYEIFVRKNKDIIGYITYRAGCREHQMINRRCR